MTIEIEEKFDSGRATAAGLESANERRYIVSGTHDELEVIAAVDDYAPVSIDGMRRGSCDVNPLGGGLWEAVVPYEGIENDSQYTFETGGGTVHITQSLSTIARYAASGETAPDFGGAIGVNGDNISGTDITVPVYNFAETHRIPVGLVTSSYKLALFAATGKTNGSSFKGFSAGEVLFLGASGSRRGLEEWEISFKFAASPNVTNLNLGTITVSSKKGWEYMWVRFRDEPDGTAKALVKRPVAAYVERVYESADFSTLGIGT